MDRDTAVNLVALRLGNRPELAESIIAEMQLAQQSLEIGLQLPQGGTFLPWFLLTEKASTTTLVLEERLSVPADFLGLPDEEEAALWLDDKALVPSDYADLVHEFKDSEPGEPTHYALVGEYFRLRPIPSAVFPISMLYFGRGAVLDANIENIWLKEAPLLLISQTTMQVADYLADHEAMQKAGVVASKEAMRIYNTTIARQEAHRSRVMYKT
jgi:hypothetical protein